MQDRQRKAKRTKPAAPSPIDRLTIGEAAKRVGLTSRAVRYYERIGLVQPATRGARNYRVYGEDALRELRFVARCRAVGMPIAEIQALRADATGQSLAADRVELLRHQLTLTEARIRALLKVRHELRLRLAMGPDDGSAPTMLRLSAGGR